MTKFTVKVQPSKDNDYAVSQHEYSKEYVIKEIALDEIHLLSLEDVILDVAPGNIAVYQQEVVTTLSWEGHYLDDEQIAVLKESKVNKLRRLAIRLVIGASALTTAIVGWNVAHSEKSVGELLYPSTGAYSYLSKSMYKVPCSSVEQCNLIDTKASAKVYKLVHETSDNPVVLQDAVADTIDSICTANSNIFGPYQSKECVEHLKPLTDKLLDKADKAIK